MVGINSTNNENIDSHITCTVIPFDRRKNQQSEGLKRERRSNNCFIIEKTLDQIIRHLEQNMVQQKEDVRFAHNKKFLILGSIFTLLTIIASFVIGLADSFDYDPGKMSKTLIATICISLAFFILIISAINFLIIKYLIDLKLSQVIALRGLNCNRQCLHSMIYAKIEGKLPRKLPTVEDEKTNLTETILDPSTIFWEIYGRHEKYPLNNVELRERYLVVNENNKFELQKNLWYKSSDIFPVYVLAIFTVVIIALPFIAFLIEVGRLGLPPLFFMGIGAFACIWGLGFCHMVKKVVNGMLDKLVLKLSTDETFRFTKYLH